MIVAGIDAGQSTMKAVIVGDGKVLSHAVLPAGGDGWQVMAERAIEQAAEKAAISTDDIKFVTATGSGRNYVPLAQQKSPDLMCVAKGATWLLPTAKTIVDVGAEKCLTLKVSDGRPLNFAMNDKCAAGSGAFLETAAAMLRLSLDEIGPISLLSQEEIDITNTCAVFAESEIISLIHAKKQPEDILKGVFNGLALRVYSLMTRIGVEADVVMVGGVARNVGMVKVLENQIGTELLVPEDPQIVGALGAALMAKEKAEG